MVSARTSAAAARARLVALYLTALGLCAMMICWVAILPGSCTISRLAAAAAGGRGAAARGAHAADPVAALGGFLQRYYDGGFLAMSAQYVPPTLITKYRTHPLVCAAHVLPSALWSALAPLQLHPRMRRLAPRMHRLSGRVLVATALIMSGGYALIHVRNLHFHANDFPSLEQGEALSLVAPGLWGWLGGAWVVARGTRGSDGYSGGGYASTAADSNAAALSAFMMFEQCAAAWFAATAVMTALSAWWGARSTRLAAATATAGSGRVSGGERNSGEGVQSVGTRGGAGRSSGGGQGGISGGRTSGNQGGNGGGGWVASHRAWAVRHVAAGLSVATQRVLMFAAHSTCAAAAATSWTDWDASVCSAPSTQKGIFADTLVAGTALCVVAAEVNPTPKP